MGRADGLLYWRACQARGVGTDLAKTFGCQEEVKNKGGEKRKIIELTRKIISLKKGEAWAGNAPQTRRSRPRSDNKQCRPQQKTAKSLLPKKSH